MYTYPIQILQIIQLDENFKIIEINVEEFKETINFSIGAQILEINGEPISHELLMEYRNYNLPDHKCIITYAELWQVISIFYN